jgi:hypothetical protein
MCVFPVRLPAALQEDLKADGLNVDVTEYDDI